MSDQERKNFLVSTIFLDDEGQRSRDYEPSTSGSRVRTIYGDIPPGKFVVIDDVRPHTLNAWRDQQQLVVDAQSREIPELIPDEFSREITYAAAVEVISEVSEQGLSFPLIKLLSDELDIPENDGVLVAVSLDETYKVTLNESHWFWVSKNPDEVNGEYYMVAITDSTHPLIIESENEGKYAYIISTSHVEFPFGDEIEGYLQSYPDLQQYEEYLKGRN